MTRLQGHLAAIGACMGAREWAGDRTAAQVWDECERADWLLWWAGTMGRNSHQKIVLTVVTCARTALHYVPDGEERPRLAIEAAERWAKDPSEKNRAAALAARDAAWVAGRGSPGGSAARAAIWAAAQSAGTIVTVAYGATLAAGSTIAASAIGVGAEVATNQQMCRIIRSMLVCPFQEVA